MGKVGGGGVKNKLESSNVSVMIFRDFKPIEYYISGIGPVRERKDGIRLADIVYTGHDLSLVSHAPTELGFA